MKVGNIKRADDVQPFVAHPAGVGGLFLGRELLRELLRNDRAFAHAVAFSVALQKPTIYSSDARRQRPYCSSLWRRGLSARQISRVTPAWGSASPHSAAISATIAMSSSAQAMVCVAQFASALLAALLMRSALRSFS